jgi:hypothetical protein
VAKPLIHGVNAWNSAKSSIISIVVLSRDNRMFTNMDEEFTDFSPAEIEAMRYAYRQMLDGFSNRFISESEKRELASSILEALGRPMTREGVKLILKLVNSDNL